MKLTNQENIFEKMNEKVQDITDFFDFLVIIFCLIEENDEYRCIQDYKTWLETESQMHKKLQGILQFQFQTSKFVEITKPFWLEFCNERKQRITAIMVATLSIVDINFKDWFEKQSDRMPIVGPLNTEATINEAVFYLSSGETFQDDFIQRNKLYVGRNIFSTSPEGILDKLKYFRIIKKNTLGDILPQIIRFNDKQNRIQMPDDSIKIAIVPASRTSWVSKSFGEKKLTFDVVYKNDFKESINEGCQNLLIDMEEAKVNIAVFPELYVNEKTIEIVEKLLAINGSRSSNLKLVFLGSFWGNKSNVAYVLSGQGQKLFEVKKQVPFVDIEKKTDGGIQETYENIDKVKNMVLLDYPQIGRIAYFVCKDALSTSLSDLAFNQLRSNFQVISAYTPKTAEFRTETTCEAKTMGVISVVCNSCAALNIKEEHPIDDESGFLAIPFVKQTSKELETKIYNKQIYCDCEKCGNQSFECYSIFKMFRKNGDDINYINVECE